MRKELTDADVDRALAWFKTNLERRINQYGNHTCASAHEALGVLEEELLEYKEKIRTHNVEDQMKELMDIAVGAVWAWMSTNDMDWT